MKFCDKEIQDCLLNGGKIKRKSDNFSMFLNNNGSLCYRCEYIHMYCINKQDLTSDDWEIVVPEYDWDEIIKDKVLCVFTGDVQGESYPIIGTLLQFNDNMDYPFKARTTKGHILLFEKCEPFIPSRYHIIEWLKHKYG